MFVNSLTGVKYANWTPEDASVLAGKNIFLLNITLSAGQTNRETIDNVELTPVAAVPEPSALEGLLPGTGLIGFTEIARRKLKLGT